MGYTKKIISALFLAGVSVSAMAGSVSGSFPISATIAISCTLNNSNGISFGSYFPTATSNNSGTVDVLCTSGVPWTLTANAGNGTVSNRVMKNGSNALNYNLFVDSNNSNLLGDGSTGTSMTGTGSGATQTKTIYAQIPSGQFLPQGAYSDNITLSLSY